MSKPYRDMTEVQQQRHRETVKKYRENNPEKLQAYQDHRKAIRMHVRWKGTARQRYLQQKQGAVTLVGGVCVRCGLDDMRCLEIDHIIRVNGDRSLYGAKLYRHIIKSGNTENLQVLCANCHAIKTYEESQRV